MLGDWTGLPWDSTSMLQDGIRKGPSAWGSPSSFQCELETGRTPPPHHSFPPVFVFARRCSINVCPIKTKTHITICTRVPENLGQMLVIVPVILGVDEYTASFQKMLHKGIHLTLQKRKERKKERTFGLPSTSRRRKQGSKSKVWRYESDVHL